MKLWTFLDYHSEDGRNLIKEWYEMQEEAVKAAFDITVNNLAGTKDWSDTKEFKVLTGPHAGLCELRFKVVKRQFRPLGFWGVGNCEFILVLGCEKSGRARTPHNAFDLALEIKQQFLSGGKGSIHEHSF